MITTATAPGKLIVLGEHAVVYGKPAVALAIDKRFACTIQESDATYLNGNIADFDSNPHIRKILEMHGLRNIAITTESAIPPSSGLGSSAALSVALTAAVRKHLKKEIDENDISMEAFEAEYTAQGRASPIDTSCSTHGKGVALNCPKDVGKHLWTISKCSESWDVSDIPVPRMTFVVGYTGIRAATGPLVEKVKKFREHSRFASDIIDEIGNITLEGMKAMNKNDIEELGRIMTQDHKLLSILGVSCKELNKYVDASLAYSYGAKLTGSGGGGSMIALTERPDLVCEAIRLRGGQPFVVRTGVDGVSVDP
ncbi:MAG: mevalonate kinase [Candidatus Methanomethylophilaceae archaeon]